MSLARKPQKAFWENVETAVIIVGIILFNVLLVGFITGYPSSLLFTILEIVICLLGIFLGVRTYGRWRREKT